MLILLALPVVLIVAALHRYLATFAPTNVLVRSARRQQPRFRTAFMLAGIAIILVAMMHLAAEAVTRGAPGWLNLLVLVLAWDAIKIGLLAVSFILRVIVGVAPPVRGAQVAGLASDFIGSARV